MNNLERFRTAMCEIFMKMRPSFADKEDILSHKYIVLEHEPSPLRFTSGNYNALRSDLYIGIIVPTKDYDEKVSDMIWHGNDGSLKRSDYLTLFPIAQFIAIYNADADLVMIEKGNGLNLPHTTVASFEEAVKNFTLKKTECYCGGFAVGYTDPGMHQVYCPISPNYKEIT